MLLLVGLSVILLLVHGPGGVAGMIAGGAAAAAAAYGHHGHGHGHGGQGGYVHNAANAMGMPGFSGHSHGKFKHGKHGHGKFKQGKHGMLKKHGFKKWK